LETCVHILGNEDQTLDQIYETLDYTFNDTTARLKDSGVLDQDTLQFNWAIGSGDDTHYAVWGIEHDRTVKCEQAGVCFSQDEFVDCGGVLFYPVEFVSPILDVRDDFSQIDIVFNNYFMNDSLLYMFNITQGLHIHISNPRMDLRKFVMMWYNFEPLIMEFLAPERRQYLNEQDLPHNWSLPLYKLVNDDGITTIDELVEEIADTKAYSVYIVDIDNPRVEIRLHEGTMDYRKVKGWIVFCNMLVCTSVEAPLIDINISNWYNEDGTGGFMDKYKNMDNALADLTVAYDIPEP
jgi:hypothetical protein